MEETTMKNDLTCALVRDLLPSYVEGLTSEETNTAVEAHLASCPACAAIRDHLVDPEPESEEEAREVDYLKKVKRRSGKRVVLAVLLTLLVVIGAILAKVFLIGSPASADTMAARTWTEGDMLRVEVTSGASANAWWGWDTEVENGTARITAREGIVSPIHPTAYGELGIPLEGLKEVYLCGKLIWQDGVEITRYARAVYEARTPYVGDASAVGRLLAALDTWYGPSEYDYTISLQTAAEPYGLTLHFSDVTAHISGAAEAVNRRMEALSPLLLALVDNLGQVQWTYMDTAGTAQTGSMTLEEAEAELPGWVDAYHASYSVNWTAPERLKGCAASAADVQHLLNLLDLNVPRAAGEGFRTSQALLPD